MDYIGMLLNNYNENHISYEVLSCWSPIPELEFYVSFNDNGLVKYRKIRNGKEIKGELNVTTSLYFKEVFNTIDFKEMEKFKDEQDFIIDGTACFLTVKKDNKLYNPSWTMGAVKSRQISSLYRLIRLCEKKNNYYFPPMSIE